MNTHNLKILFISFVRSSLRQHNAHLDQCLLYIVSGPCNILHIILYHAIPWNTSLAKSTCICHFHIQIELRQLLWVLVCNVCKCKDYFLQLVNPGSVTASVNLAAKQGVGLHFRIMSSTPRRQWQDKYISFAQGEWVIFWRLLHFEFSQVCGIEESQLLLGWLAVAMVGHLLHHLWQSPPPSIKMGG